MRKLLKWLLVIQEVSNKGREPKLGRGFFEARRLNPYNPLSYVVVVITFVAALVCFGVVGMWKEVDTKNPFKWD